MTKKEITLLKKFYATRIETLNLAIKGTKKLVKDEASSESYGHLLIMRAEYIDKLDNLSIDKEYTIAFEGSGWNTTMATNDEDALKFAKAEYDGKHTKVKSVTASDRSTRDLAIIDFNKSY